MRSRTIIKFAGLLAGVAMCLPLHQVQFAAAQQPAPTAAPQGAPAGGRGVVDPRVQQRTKSSRPPTTCHMPSLFPRR